MHTPQPNGDITHMEMECVQLASESNQFNDIFFPSYSFHNAHTPHQYLCRSSTHVSWCESYKTKQASDWLNLIPNAPHFATHIFFGLILGTNSQARDTMSRTDNALLPTEAYGRREWSVRWPSIKFDSMFDRKCLIWIKIHAYYSYKSSDQMTLIWYQIEFGRINESGVQ